MVQRNINDKIIFLEKLTIKIILLIEIMELKEEDRKENWKIFNNLFLQRMIKLQELEQKDTKHALSFDIEFIQKHIDSSILSLLRLVFSNFRLDTITLFNFLVDILGKLIIFDNFRLLCFHTVPIFPFLITGTLTIFIN